MHPICFREDLAALTGHRKFNILFHGEIQSTDYFYGLLRGKPGLP